MSNVVAVPPVGVTVTCSCEKVVSAVAASAPSAVPM